LLICVSIEIKIGYAKSVGKKNCTQNHIIYVKIIVFRDLTLLNVYLCVQK